MSHECFDIDELGKLAELGPDDPRSQHVRECPRCRNLLASLREFRSPTKIPDGAQVREAREHILRALEQELRPAVDIRPSWFQRISLRPAFGIAVGVAVILIAFGIADRRDAVDQPIVRRGGSEVTVTPLVPEVLVDGQVRLSWNRLPEATRYQVVFFDTALVELVACPATADTFMLIAPALQQRLGQSGQEVLWEVRAQRTGKGPVHSSLVGVRLP